VEEPDGPHYFFRFWRNGRVVASTHISHGRKPVSDGLVSAMAKELGMQGKGPLLRGAIDCRVSADRFEAELLASRKR
jgi:hypothetical protein